MLLFRRHEDWSQVLLDADERIGLSYRTAHIFAYSVDSGGDRRLVSHFPSKAVFYDFRATQQARKCRRFWRGVGEAESDRQSSMKALACGWIRPKASSRSSSKGRQRSVVEPSSGSHRQVICRRKEPSGTWALEALNRGINQWIRRVRICETIRA